ncbi:MAG: PucR family transcriptional regulator [Bacillota bacterium]
MLRESGITVRQALEMECLEKSKIIAGHNGIDSVITRVNIMADPDALDWVSEGELLLTTAYSFKKDDIESQKRLIMESSKKKLAGIGIKIYPYIDGLSKEVIDLADALNFPIIDLYYATAFTEIMTPIFREIFNNQVAVLQKVERVHSDLMGVVLRGGSVRQIIKTLKQTIQNPIVIRDHYFDQYIYDIDKAEKCDYRNLVEKCKIFFESHNEHKRIDITTERNDQWEEGTIKKIIIPIIVKGNVFGHILTWAQNREICNVDRVALETASTIIALEFLRKSSVYEVEHRYKVEFFESLITADIKRKQAAIGRANIYKLEEDAYYTVNNVSMKNPFGKSKKELAFTEAKNRLTMALERQFQQFEWNGLVINKDDKISILTTWHSEKEAHKKAKEFGQQILQVVKEFFSEEYVLIGIGRPYKGLENVYKSMQDADKIIESGYLFKKEKIVIFDELGIYKIFCQDHLKEELIKFYKEVLEDLVEYDRTKNTELVKTLQIYFETNGNLKRMSEIMYTHYNTVLYRIQRIQEITGMRVDNAEERFNLETALKIMNILRQSAE